MADLVSSSNTLMSSSMLLLAAYIVLSSAKFSSSTSLINKSKSFMKILNKMGPNIFYVLNISTQKSLHPLINHIHEVVQQVSHEEYSQKPLRDS